jgi:hypothetical protein
MKKLSRVILIVLAAITTSLSFADELLEPQIPTSGSNSEFCSSCKLIGQMFDRFGFATDSNFFQIDGLRFSDLAVVGFVQDVSESFTDLLLSAGISPFGILGNDSATASGYVTNISLDSRTFQIDTDGTRQRMNIDSTFRIIDSEIAETDTIKFFFLRLQSFIASLRQYLLS